MFPPHRMPVLHCVESKSEAVVFFLGYGYLLCLLVFKMFNVKFPPTPASHIVIGYKGYCKQPI